MLCFVAHYVYMKTKFKVAGTHHVRLFCAAMSLACALIIPLTLLPQNQRPVRETPRWPDGRVNLNSPPGEKGLWGGSGRLAVNPRSYEPRTTLAAPIHIDNVPLQSWARALLDYRHTAFLKDEPYTGANPRRGHACGRLRMASRFWTCLNCSVSTLSTMADRIAFTRFIWMAGRTLQALTWFRAITAIPRDIGKRMYWSSTPS